MHRVEQWLFWKFGEVAVLLCKNILKFDHSALSTVLILALFVMALPNKCMKQSWTILTIEISPSIHWFLPGLFPAHRWSFWMSHCTTYCARLSLVLCQAVVHVCSRLACILRAATCCVRQRESCSRSLNILKASMPMVLSQSSRLLFLASHRMEMTRECKIPSRFSLEIHIFSTFAWSVPMLVPKHNSRFSSFLQHTLLVMMID